MRTRKRLMSHHDAQIFLTYIRTAYQAINEAIDMPIDSDALHQTQTFALSECEQALGILRTMQPPLRWKYAMRVNMERTAYHMRQVSRKPSRYDIRIIHATIRNLGRQVSELKPLHARR